MGGFYSPRIPGALGSEPDDGEGMVPLATQLRLAAEREALENEAARRRFFERTASREGQIRPDLPQTPEPDYSAEGVRRSMDVGLGLENVPTASKPTTDPPPYVAPGSGEEDRGSRITAVRMPDGKIRFITENLAGEYTAGRPAIPEYGLAERAPAELLGRDAGVAAFMAKEGRGIPEEAAALSRAATAQRLAEAGRNPIDIIEAAPVHEAFDLDRRRRALEYAKEGQLMQAYEIDPRKRESAELLTEANKAGLLGAQAKGAEAEAGLIGAKARQLEDPVEAARRSGTAGAAESEATFNARQEAGMRFAQSPAGAMQVQATIEQVLAADKKLAALAKADPNVMAEVRRRAEIAVAKAHATGVLPGIAQENVLARDPYAFQSMSGGR